MRNSKLCHSHPIHPFQPKVPRSFPSLLANICRPKRPCILTLQLLQPSSSPLSHPPQNQSNSSPVCHQALAAQCLRRPLAKDDKMTYHTARWTSHGPTQVSAWSEACQPSGTWLRRPWRITHMTSSFSMQVCRREKEKSKVSAPYFHGCLGGIHSPE